MNLQINLLGKKSIEEVQSFLDNNQSDIYKDGILMNELWHSIHLNWANNKDFVKIILLFFLREKTVKINATPRFLSLLFAIRFTNKQRFLEINNYVYEILSENKDIPMFTLLCLGNDLLEIKKKKELIKEYFFNAELRKLNFLLGVGNDLNLQIFLDIVEDLVNSEDYKWNVNQAYCTLFFLSFLDTTLFDKSILKFRNIQTKFARNYLTSSVIEVINNTKINNEVINQNKYVRPIPIRKLKIAVCISGQLRGYKEVFDTWEQFGFREHDTDFFIHTWSNIGKRKLTSSQSERSFSGKFKDIFSELCLEYGLPYLKDTLPSLFNYFDIPEKIGESELMEFYSAKKVIVEDETKFQEFSNQEKMHYKIEQCYKLAKEYDDYDLIIRIRPDLKINVKTAIDFHHILLQSRLKNYIYTDRPKQIRIDVNDPFIYIGDQFAIGGVEQMHEYCTTWSKTNSKLFFKLDKFFGHVTLGLNSFLSGLKIEKLENVNFGPLKAQNLINDEQIKSLLSSDLGSGKDKFIKDLIDKLG